MYPWSFLCEKAKIKQRTFSKKELCEIGMEALWESQFTCFLCKYKDRRLWHWFSNEFQYLWATFLSWYTVSFEKAFGTSRDFNVRGFDIEKCEKQPFLQKKLHITSILFFLLSLFLPILWCDFEIALTNAKIDISWWPKHHFCKVCHSVSTDVIGKQIYTHFKIWFFANTDQPITGNFFFEFNGIWSSFIVFFLGDYESNVVFLNISKNAIKNFLKLYSGAGPRRYLDITLQFNIKVTFTFTKGL